MDGVQESDDAPGEHRAMLRNFIVVSVHVNRGWLE